MLISNASQGTSKRSFVKRVWRYQRGNQNP